MAETRACSPSCRPLSERTGSQLIAAFLISLVMACSSREPVELVRLDVSERGSYTIDGEAVDGGALMAALLKKKRAGQKLFVFVAAAKGAQSEAVRIAFEAVQAAGGQAGTVGNEVFYPEPAVPKMEK